MVRRLRTTAGPRRLLIYLRGGRQRRISRQAPYVRHQLSGRAGNLLVNWGSVLSPPKSAEAPAQNWTASFSSASSSANEGVAGAAAEIGETGLNARDTRRQYVCRENSIKANKLSCNCRRYSPWVTVAQSVEAKTCLKLAVNNPTIFVPPKMYKYVNIARYIVVERQNIMRHATRVAATQRFKIIAANEVAIFT